MKEHPIIFSSDMVRAILEARKTQMRRIVKPQPTSFRQRVDTSLVPRTGCKCTGDDIECPYGIVGDRLWVRESFREVADSRKIDYKATSNAHAKWKPSIHMPRWASRITLEIIRIRAEMLQDISEKDAAAEGCWGGVRDANEGVVPCSYTFKEIWNSIHWDGIFDWDANPWVWVVEFKKLVQTSAQGG